MDQRVNDPNRPQRRSRSESAAKIADAVSQMHQTAYEMDKVVINRSVGFSSDYCCRPPRISSKQSFWTTRVTRSLRNNRRGREVNPLPKLHRQLLKCTRQLTRWIRYWSLAACWLFQLAYLWWLAGCGGIPRRGSTGSGPNPVSTIWGRLRCVRPC